jgi:SAM-dependent methyltransferase
MTARSSAVSADGSPVAVYQALPAMGEPELIHAASKPRARILELGCGAGRITHELVRLGHEVVAVDNCEEMLRCVRGAKTVHCEIESLALPGRFDSVLLVSHFINDPDERRREVFMRVCARHLDRDGVVIVQRYSPALLETRDTAESQHGEVSLGFRVTSVDKTTGHFRATASYRLGSMYWEQCFEAQILMNRSLSRLARAVNLRIDRWLDERQTWASLKWKRSSMPAETPE